MLGKGAGWADGSGALQELKPFAFLCSPLLLQCCLGCCEAWSYPALSRRAGFKPDFELRPMKAHWLVSGPGVGSNKSSFSSSDLCLMPWELAGWPGALALSH